MMNRNMLHPNASQDDGATATWFALGGVIHVISIRLDGTETGFPDAPTLGECFGRMPRALWEWVRYEFHYGTPESSETS
jgi:hypothetical protein